MGYRGWDMRTRLGGGLEGRRRVKGKRNQNGPDASSSLIKWFKYRQQSLFSSNSNAGRDPAPLWRASPAETRLQVGERGCKCGERSQILPLYRCSAGCTKVGRVLALENFGTHGPSRPQVHFYAQACDA